MAWLERWYDHRDTMQYTDNFNTGRPIKHGWMPSHVMPDEVRTYQESKHGTEAPDGRMYVVYKETYRYDLYQMEDALRGNGTCVHGQRGLGGRLLTCKCYAWPGAILSRSWTNEDEKLWLNGSYTGHDPESAIRDDETRQHLVNLYDFDPWLEFNKPNDVVLVVEPDFDEESDVQG